MAYYAPVTTLPIATTDNGKEPVRMDGVGAYFAYDATHEAVQPVNGLAGAMGPGAELADEAARSIIERRQPVMVASEWASAITDAVWKQSSSSTHLTLLPLTDADLVRIRQAAFGHALPVIGIIAARPAALADAEAAFGGTAYDLHEVLAVAAIGDRRPMPQAFFLFVGKERDPDDRAGGGALMAETARALGGKLVHIISMQAKCIDVPRVPIQQALRAQFPPGAGTPPGVPGAPPAPPTPQVISLSGARAPARGFSTGGLGLVNDTTLGFAAALAVVGIGYYLKEKL